MRVNAVKTYIHQNIRTNYREREREKAKSSERLRNIRYDKCFLYLCLNGIKFDALIAG